LSKVCCHFCSVEKSGQATQQDKVTDKSKPQVSTANDVNESADSENLRQVPDPTKKPASRNRELERLGVVAPVLLVSDSRRQCTVKKLDCEKSTVRQESRANTSNENKSCISVTDDDGEISTSETDLDGESGSEEEDISDDNVTNDAASDCGSEVIFVSEVQGKNSGNHNDLKLLEKKNSSSGLEDIAVGSVPFKKPNKQSASQAQSELHGIKPEASSWWMHKVGVLENTMSEMKARFAEILRQKVSIFDI